MLLKQVAYRFCDVGEWDNGLEDLFGHHDSQCGVEFRGTTVEHRGLAGARCSGEDDPRRSSRHRDQAGAGAMTAAARSLVHRVQTSLPLSNRGPLLERVTSAAPFAPLCTRTKGDHGLNPGWRATYSPPAAARSRDDVRRVAAIASGGARRVPVDSRRRRRAGRRSETPPARPKPRTQQLWRWLQRHQKTRR